MMERGGCNALFVVTAQGKLRYSVKEGVVTVGNNLCLPLFFYSFAGKVSVC